MYRDSKMYKYSLGLLKNITSAYYKYTFGFKYLLDFFGVLNSERTYNLFENRQITY